jgi:hypothetical protein
MLWGGENVLGEENMLIISYVELWYLHIHKCLHFLGHVLEYLISNSSKCAFPHQHLDSALLCFQDGRHLQYVLLAYFGK